MTQMKEHESYKRKIKKISSKIDTWHMERIQTKKGTFEADEEFIAIGNSPSKFESDSEEEAFIESPQVRETID